MKELVKRMTMRSLAKTQSEHDFLVKKNIKVFAPSELNKGIYGTGICRLCTDNLFSYIPLISTYTSKDPRTGKAINTLQPYCIKCVERFQEWKTCKVYSRHTLEDLVKYFDSVELYMRTCISKTCTNHISRIVDTQILLSCLLHLSCALC